VPLYVGLLQVVQQPAPLADQLIQPAPGMEVLLVYLQVLAQLVDASRQDGNLDFRRPRVRLVLTELGDNLGLLFLRERHLCTSVLFRSPWHHAAAGGLARPS